MKKPGTLAGETGQKDQRMDVTAHGGLRPPQDAEAERAAIGSMLIDDRTCDDVFAIVKPDDFADELGEAAAYSIWRAWRDGDPIEAAIVLRELRNTGSGLAEYAAIYLGEVAEAVATAAHAIYYARRVAEAARKRRLQELGVEIAQGVLGDRSAADLAAEAMHVASQVADGTSGGNAWTKWETSLDNREQPRSYEIADRNNQLNRLILGPEQFVVLGGVPGTGKTALAMQVVIDALLRDESLTALIACCEMTPTDLLDRQLSRLSDVNAGAIRDRTFHGVDEDRVRAGREILLSLRERLHFMGPPFEIPRVQAATLSKQASIVVVDYVQRFKPFGAVTDQRQQVSDVMSECRELAMRGPCVVAVSALSRAGNFRESSEVEYACDSGFVLEGSEEDQGDVRELVAKCIKNRHGPPQSIALTFTGSLQRHDGAAEVELNEDLAPFAGVAS